MIKSIFVFISLVISLPVYSADEAVFEASREGDISYLSDYISRGGDLNVRNEKGYTPFILSTYNKQLEFAQLLVESGADACAVDYSGNSAYMGVAFKGNVDVAKWLLDNTTCSVNHQNYAGQTALMMAALFDRETLVSLLIDHGADADVRDRQGNSAVTLAQGQGLTRIIDLVQFKLAQ